MFIQQDFEKKVNKGANSYFKNEKQEYLKALDTIGNCQRLVFTLGVSQYYA